jgi:hypothetical protein
VKSEDGRGKREEGRVSVLGWAAFAAADLEELYVLEVEDEDAVGVDMGAREADGLIKAICSRRQNW